MIAFKCDFDKIKIKFLRDYEGVITVSVWITDVEILISEEDPGLIQFVAKLCLK